MYALCPKCQKTVTDTGTGGKLVCDNCGTSIRSRLKPEMLKLVEQEQDIESMQTVDGVEYSVYGKHIAEKPGKDEKPFKVPPEERGDRKRPPVRQLPSEYIPPPYSPYEGFKGIWKFITMIISFFVLVGLLSYFVIYLFQILALGPTLTYVLPELMHVSHQLWIPLPVPPFLSTLGTIPGGYLTVLYFIFIVAAILLSVFWLCFTEGHEAWHLLKKYGSRFQAPPFNSDNSFFLLPRIFFTLLFFNVIIVLIIYFMGSEPTTPAGLQTDTTPLWVLMYKLANASVWEELATRVLFIGIPLLALELLRRRVRGRKYTDLKRFFVGGKMKIGIIEGFLIFFSAAMFGLAHISGWGPWKFIPTFLSGFAFGYLFVVKGLHVAILLHFAFDYLSIPIDLFNAGIGVTIMYGLAILFLIFLGMIFFIYYCYRFGTILYNNATKQAG